jgi:prefoldin subunit 5
VTDDEDQIDDLEQAIDVLDQLQETLKASADKLAEMRETMQPRLARLRRWSE